MNIDDTIAAISTAQGKGGIGIVRISGRDTLNVIKKIFFPVSGKDVFKIKSHTINYGHIIVDDNIIDEVLVTIMKAPNSYTREDIAEINCHGGIKAVNSVLFAAVKNGARVAEPGEFTKRAFLNGRIDLTQAEAVIDIINAKTELSHKAAVNRLEGRLSKKVKELRNDIITMLANIEAAIDYPEHDDETMTYDTIKKGCYNVMDKIKKLLKTADTGKIIKEGIKTVIIGTPNVGKSSLLNVLVDEERAIVTDIPGTTRDILQEYIDVNGIPLNIIDTAGIRNTEDVIEKIGVEKSKKYADEADLIFMMIDGSRPLSKDDIEILEFIKNKKVILIINKVDLPQKTDYNKICSFIGEKNIIKVSIKEDIGIDTLFDNIKKLFFEGNIDFNDEIIISNQRNKASLFNALKSIENVIETVDNSMPEDFISMDLIEAYKYLGQIVGESVEEDIIDKIFSEFCLGK